MQWPNAGLIPLLLSFLQAFTSTAAPSSLLALPLPPWIPAPLGLVMPVCTPRGRDGLGFTISPHHTAAMCGERIISAHSLPSICCRCRLTGALATACGDDAIRIFEEEPLSNPQQPTFALTAHMPRAHSQDVNCVAWNPKEPGLLASCSDDGEMAFWKYQRPEVC